MTAVGEGLADVLVVGGGIAGIQASLDLAAAGFRVVLAERDPAIGGKMARLDKTFPTNDCSMCIESPKFIECDRHPNIEIRTCAEVERVEGGPGDFEVVLLRRPRFVREDLCTGCTTCSEYCPIPVPDPFNQGLSRSRATHILFPQAVPLVPYIDERCAYLRDGRCTICEGVCKNGAIDLRQKPRREALRVGAIVLAPGTEPFDPRPRGDFGYGTFPNVVTSLEFERLLCATGPHEGEILRPSDRAHPRRIAWVHCVGSRQVLEGGRSYCSSVCCSYVQKQVILAKEHDPDAACVVFHNDVRSFGKDFERFYRRAASLPGVRFVRSYVEVVREDPRTRDVAIRWADGGGAREEAFDLVVLGVGLGPPAEAARLAERLGIDLDRHGFCRTDPARPLETTRPGVYVCGAFRGPMDIPESVAGASGAGALAGALLRSRRGRLDAERIYPAERDAAGEAPRVGVFVCRCGANIGRVVDVPSLTAYAAGLPGVAHAEEGLFVCSTDAAARIAAAIREKGLNRVVVAACTPRTHEPLFRDTLREGGINPYYFEMANIREHCSWVHAKEKEAATAKAKDIVRMAVARAAGLEPLRDFALPVLKSALVVGGGPAGMTAALALADLGFDALLVERAKELGGMARRLRTTIEGLDVRAFVEDRVRRVYRHPRIRVFHGATLEGVSGYVGDFATTVRWEGRVETLRHGAIVLATGAAELRPGEHLLGEDDRVWTQLDLEERLAAGDPRLAGARSLVMIQCVGCRQEGREYCARVCCSQAVKNARALRARFPDLEVSVLYRDLRTYGRMEDASLEAARAGVRFARWEPEGPPVVERATDEEGRLVLCVSAPDPVLGQRLALDADVVVLSVAAVPPDGVAEVARLFKVALGPDGFLQEAHVKLRPVDFAAEGVFLCGSGHYPKHLTEAVAQALGAAGRAATLLSRDTVAVSGAVCGVEEPRCIACGACLEACAYGAIRWKETARGRKAEVNPVLCKGDGCCASRCPTGAVVPRHYTDGEILAQVDAALAEEVGP